MLEEMVSQKYLDKCFENVQSKFGSIEKTLGNIEKHLEKQNGSVARLQEESNKRLIIVEDFRHLEKDFESVKDKVDKIDKDLLEVWFFKKYPKVFIGILTAAVLATLGISFFNKKDMKEIRTKVNYIEAYEKIPFAPTRGAVEAFPDTVK